MKTLMYLQEHCWYLLLTVLIVSSNDVSGCSCDPSSHININAVNSIGSRLSSIRNKLGTASSKQLCVPYSMRSFLGWSWPVFDTNDINSAIVKQSCSPSNSDGSIDCLIEDPYFSLSDQCYPPKYFCIHQVMCPLNNVATIHCSSVGLPENNGQCLDAVHINSGRVRGKQVCGTTYSNCFPDINEAGGSLIQITFTSGQCCQHCGYRFWVRCLPHTGYYKRSVREPVELEEEGNFEGPRLPIKKTFRSVVPFGAVMTYANGTLTVKLGTLKLQERKTPKLQVRDDIAYGPGVLFEAKTTANRSFVGYGIMTIYPNRIHYYQQGIPPQEEPNSTEKQFIKTVIASIKSKVKSFIVVNTSFETARRGPNGPGASSCQCSQYRPPPGVTPPGVAPPGVVPPPGPNGPPGGSHFLEDARYYAKYSNKPIVKYWAKLYLKYYDNKPATPTPPTQGPTTASTAPPTRGPPSIPPPTEGPPIKPGIPTIGPPVKPGIPTIGPPVKPGIPTIGPPTLAPTH